MSKKMKVNFNVMKLTLRVFSLVCLFFVFNCKSEIVEKENTDNNPCDFHIGGVLSSNESEHHFKQTIEVMHK